MNAKELVSCGFFPVVGLKITTACRMRCVFCCEQSKYVNDAPKENYIKLIDICKLNGTKRICFTGGDPLRSPYIEECLERSINYGMENVVMTSDGFLLQNLDIPPEYFTSLRISVHGIGKEHNKISGIENSFEEIEKSLPRLIRLGYPIAVTVVLTLDTLKSAINLVEWCVKQGIKNIYFANLLKSGLGEKYINQKGRIDNKDFFNLINDLKSTYSNKGVRIIYHPYEKNAECVLVYGNGDMYIDPCFDNESFQKYIGNVFKENPKQIFKNFSNSGKIWDDYLERVSRSTLLESR